MAKRPGVSVAIAVGKPKRPMEDDLGAPSDLGGMRPRNPPQREPSPRDMPEEPEEDIEPDEPEGADSVMLTLTREQASVMADLLSQIQEQLGDQGLGPNPDEEEDEDYPLARSPRDYGA